MRTGVSIEKEYLRGDMSIQRVLILFLLGGIDEVFNCLMEGVW
jgi:hypothetical protein